MYETHSGDKKLEMQVDNVFAKQIADVDITAAAPAGFDQAGGGKRKSIRKKHRTEKPYHHEGYIQASVSCQLEIVHTKKNAMKDEYVQLHMDVLRLVLLFSIYSPKNFFIKKRAAATITI